MLLICHCVLVLHRRLNSGRQHVECQEPHASEKVQEGCE